MQLGAISRALGVTIVATVARIERRSKWNPGKDFPQPALRTKLPPRAAAITHWMVEGYNCQALKDRLGWTLSIGLLLSPSQMTLRPLRFATDALRIVRFALSTISRHTPRSKLERRFPRFTRVEWLKMVRKGQHGGRWTRQLH